MSASGIDSVPGAALPESAGRAVVYAWVFALVLALYPYTADPVGPVKHLATAAAAVALCGARWWIAARGGIAAAPTPWALGFAGAWIAAPVFASWMRAAPDGPPWFMAGPAVDAALPLLAAWLVAVLAAPLFREPAAAWRLCGVVAVAVGLSSVYAFVQRFGADPFPWAATDIEEYLRLPATYGHPNFAGHALLLAIPPTFALAWSRRGWWAVAPLILMVAHLQQTGMRAGMIALAAAAAMGGVCWIVIRRRRGPATPGVALALGALVCLGGGAVLFAAHRVLSGDWVPMDGSAVLRYHGFWGAALMALEGWPLGLGAGQYLIQNPLAWTPFEQRWFVAEGRMNDHAHNEYLETMVEGGLLACAMLLAAMAHAARPEAGADPARRRLSLALSAALCAAAVDALFGFNLRVPVSAALFLLWIGLSDATREAAGPARRARVWPLAPLSVAAVVAFAGTAAFFESERARSVAQGATRWAQTAGEDPAAARQAAEEAAEHAARAIALRPWDARARQARAQALDLLGDRTGAAAEGARAAAHDPNNPARLVAAAQLAFREGAAAAADPEGPWARAEELAGRALEICAAYAPAEEVLARLRIARAQALPESAARAALFAEAADHLEAALRGSLPNRAELQAFLGRARLGAGDAAGAFAALRQAAETDPARAATWELFEAAAAQAGDAGPYRDALAAQIARPAPFVDDAARLALRRRLAAVYAAAPETAGLAHALSDAVIAEAPGSLEDWARFARTAPAGDALSALGARVAALPEADRAAVPPLAQVAAEAAEGGAFALRRLAERAAQIPAAFPGPPGGATGDSVDWLAEPMQRAALRGDLDAELRALLRAGAGAVAVASGAWEAGEALLRGLAPELPRGSRAAAHAWRAAALLRLGDVEAAVAEARAAHRLGPGDRYVLLTLARCVAAAGRTGEARTVYQGLAGGGVDDALRRAAAAELAALEAAGGAP